MYKRQPEREKEWKDFKNRKSKTINISNFSFFDNPNYTLNKLIEIAKCEYKCKNSIINFHDNDLLDISPFMIWGIMVQSMFPYFEGGKMSPVVKAVLKYVKIQDFSKHTYIPDSNLVSPLIIKQKKDFGELNFYRKNFLYSTIQDTEKELKDSINDWLHHGSCCLSELGETKVSGIVTEVLNNAERHGSKETNQGNWVVAGVMVKHAREKYKCFLSFVNTGDTISDNILNPDDENIRKKITSYIQRHAGKSSKISKATLATVYAMQDTISSKKKCDEGIGKGGYGLMDTVSFLNVLGHSTITEEKPAICIISGYSCVIFRDKYCDSGLDKPRTQYFNDENTKEKLPDSKYVFDLDNSFPGTIITTRFIIDKDAIERKRAEDKKDAA